MLVDKEICGVVFEVTHADMVSGVRITGQRLDMRENRLRVHLKKGARGIIDVRTGRGSGDTGQRQRESPPLLLVLSVLTTPSHRRT